MRDISAGLKKHAQTVLLRNLPADTTEEHLSAFLWQRLGWNIPPEQVTVKNLESPFDSANALLFISRAALTDFFARVLDGIAFDGRQIQVYQAKTQGREDQT